MGPGKTRDSNSNFAAKLCFDLGIELKRIEVIADDEDEIVEAARRMVDRYDMVLTSGGIGPTHDGPSMSVTRLTLADITYSSLAKAFDDDGKLEYHDETLRRMNEMGACACPSRPSCDPGKRRWNLDQQTEEQQTARKRMALFPVDSEALFVAPDLWVCVRRHVIRADDAVLSYDCAASSRSSQVRMFAAAVLIARHSEARRPSRGSH